MRPITALALALAASRIAPTPRACATGCSIAWSLGTAVPVMSVLVVGIVGLTKSDVDIEAVAARVRLPRQRSPWRSACWPP